MKKISLGLIAAFLVFLAACSDDELDTIIFTDAGWDSVNVHNYIARTIVEEGYGYDTDMTTGSTAAVIQGLRDGDIHVNMEIWTDNIKELYEESIEAGDIVRASTNFDDNEQGLYVPTYVIEGDEERGIEPMAPDLRTVADLKDYPDVFVDLEEPDRGRILNGPTGWTVEESISIKFETYGLDETMNNFIPGSESSLVADLVRAYEAGEAWVGYYWSPTWITAKYDMTMLEEPEFDRDQWNEDRGTQFPPNDVVVGVNNEFPDEAPDVFEFLENYETSSELTEEALNYMEETDADEEEAALWWMEEHEDIWTSWLDEETAKKVKDGMK